MFILEVVIPRKIDAEEKKSLFGSLYEVQFPHLVGLEGLNSPKLFFFQAFLLVYMPLKSIKLLNI